MKNIKCINLYLKTSELVKIEEHKRLLFFSLKKYKKYFLWLENFIRNFIFLRKHKTFFNLRARKFPFLKYEKNFFWENIKKFFRAVVFRKTYKKFFGGKIFEEEAGKCTRKPYNSLLNIFISTVSRFSFKINHRLNSDDKSIIYLMTCKHSNKQYATWRHRSVS